MKQIFNSSPSEIRELARTYIMAGVLSRATQCYERLLYLGILRRAEYLRLAVIYTHQGERTAAGRVIGRYKAIYKSI